MSSALQSSLHSLLPNTRELIQSKPRNYFSSSKNLFLAGKFNGIFVPRLSNYCKAVSGDRAEIEKSVARESGSEKPPFDINLAVILAGFAFEAYTTPPAEKVGKREIDAAKCQTVFLSESFVREIYDGHLLVKLKKGIDLPAMDPWGTSDPYVILQLDSQVAKSKIKWGTKEPTWNEEFALNIKQPPIHNLQVAAWDANLVTPHKRMGNASIQLEDLCDGDTHEVLLDLEGMGGGGKIELELKYKSFQRIDDEKIWWKIPIVTEFLQKSGFEPALKMILGTETVQAREFVQFAFGKLKYLNDSYLQNDWLDNKLSNDTDADTNENLELENNKECSTTNQIHVKDATETESGNNVGNNMNNSLQEYRDGNDSLSQKQFWKMLADSVNHNVIQKLGLPTPEQIKLDGFELLKNIGLESFEIAEASYIESGLATPNNQEAADGDMKDGSITTNTKQNSLPDIRKLTRDIVRQTDSILGAWMIVNAVVPKLKKEAGSSVKSENAATEDKTEIFGQAENKLSASDLNELVVDEKDAEEMRALFSTAESAMEAWAMLANALGHPTFIKSEFEKICFLDNAETDTQVAIWRDLKRKRLVIAFRGTEQSRWKDLRTDLMLAPAGLNPERIGGDFKQEVQVHSGFLSAYDSVRTRLMSLIKQAISSVEFSEQLPKWHIFVTGHSLGGALSTLLALELSSSQFAKQGTISVTVYNFGSPRVGNRRFAEIYNERVKDSWRVVNHRDIIPTIPRLMGYCHVAQPVYLAAGDLTQTEGNMDELEDGYQGDGIEEATADVLVSEFLRGERELVENILNTEINIFRSIRDGSALMQHMEDFYYITLLQSVRSKYRTTGGPREADNNLLV